MSPDPRDPRGRITTFTYQAGRLTSLADPSLGATTYAYERRAAGPGGPAPGRRRYQVRLTDPEGRTATWSLEPDPGVVPAGAEPDPAARQLVALINLLDLLPLLSPRWRLREATDPAGARTRYEYDEARGEVRVTGPDGRVSVFASDRDRRVVRVTDPRTGAVDHVPEPTTAEVVYEFDAAGKLVRAHPPVGPDRARYV